MGAIELNDPEKKATIERIKSFFDEVEVYITNIEEGKIILPIGRAARIRDLFKPINRENCKTILDTYKSTDILGIICALVGSKLSYDNLVERIANKEKVGKVFISTGYLSKLVAESELTELANLILDRIINPQTYHALILLPKVELADSLKINEAYFLIKADSNIACNFWRKYPEKSEDEEAITIGKNKTYLLIKQEGCISGFLGKKTLSLDLIEGKLKVILGLSLIQRIFETTSSKELWFSQGEKPKCDIGLFDRFQNYDYDEEGVEIGPHEANDFLDDELREYKSGEYWFRYLDKYRLPEDYADLINSLSLCKSATEPLHKLKAVGGDAERLAKSEESKSPTDILNEKLDALKNVLDSDDEYAEAIKTASEWYFEGLCTENETFKLVKYVIAIESLLGDPKKEYRIKDRLSDRCAYLLGNNLKERDKTKKSFEDIYDIRSKIIHRRSTRLEEKNVRVLSEAELLIERLIRKEIELYTKTPSS